MKKHTKIFYRAIARIRAIGEKNGMVYLDRIKTAMGTGYIRAYNLHLELIEAGIIEKPNLADIGKKRTKGNIIWRNLSKFRVPKEITEKEKARVEEERRKGQLSS